ncbi:wall-associated receptor kinase 2-like [Hordeum vulgare subsp. vulgare]|uniref:Protein kinase domain-containing protein n=1 Tax=Hordeum vulgare subsp. vulgare TaxID=112509 RepID=A0A8I7B0H2_HORVV|nr:wall-associated receptor kinase 2-like [Hordeum vulgare subsp. vulgare]
MQHTKAVSRQGMDQLVPSMNLLTAFLLLLAAAAAAAATAETPERLAAARGCQTSCGGVEIPYPFGIGGRDCFREGFEIDCVYDGPVLANTSLRVVQLSVDPAESLVMLPVGRMCYNATDPRHAEEYSHGETLMNKRGVYRFSNARNMLVVLGCNTMGTIGSVKTTRLVDDYSYYMGCMSFCNSSASAQDGQCASLGCCHVDIPPGLTHNYFRFREYDHTSMMDFSPCDYAFLVDRTNYTFRRSDLLRDTLRTSPVWLDWAIRGAGAGDGPASLSCAQANNTKEYACLSNQSYCVDAINGPGYNCNCSMGYEGNAYLVNGCTNIDECADSDKYPCKGVCRDTQGSYRCTCPPGYGSDDPTKQRCTPKFPPAAQICIGVIGGILAITLVAFVIIIRKEKRKTREFYEKNGGLTLEKAKFIKLFKMEELKPILKSGNLIGKGGFGEVYKGFVDNILVAVKKPIGGNVLENKQFANEVIIQSQVIHKNIVRLIGCCLEVDNPLLVYEYISKGSMHDILHEFDRREPLDLNVRLSIVTESAHGLAYMHSQAHTKILHGDVKPANILLDDNFVPKISDFGISRLIAIGKEHTANVIGDMTYMDPVYLQTGLLTEKSDVYSFGVVILEVISRKKATHSDNNSLVTGFLECHKEGRKATELFDSEVAALGNMELLDTLAGIAVECLSLDVDQRPLMTDVVARLLTLNRSRVL